MQSVGYARIQPRLALGAAKHRAQRRSAARCRATRRSPPRALLLLLLLPPPPPPRLLLLLLLLLLLPRRMSSPAPCGGGRPRHKDLLRCRAHHSMVSGRQRRELQLAAGSQAVHRFTEGGEAPARPAGREARRGLVSMAGSDA